MQDGTHWFSIPEFLPLPGAALYSLFEKKLQTTQPQPELKLTEGSMFSELALRTQQRCELINLTAQLQQAVDRSGVSEGMLIAQTLHTTAGLTLNENADPDVTQDLLERLAVLAPKAGDYRHVEGNSDAHIKASLVGASASIPVSKGRLVLGTWQGVYFCEFDGPRDRRVAVQLLGERLSTPKERA
jgi:secondary thiamine-phosphate synthase enzyme